MSPVTYNAITITLLVGVVIAFVAGVASVIAIFVRWKHPSRRKHVVRSLLAFAAMPLLIGAQQALLWLVFLPSQGRQQLAEANARRAAQQAESSFVKVGDPVPAFTVPTAEGVSFAVPQPGKVVLLNFFATWCGPCAVELPHLEQLWTKHQSDDRFAMLILGREETTESVREHRARHGWTFPIAADPDRAIFARFAEELIPRTFLIAADGRIVYSQAGFMIEDLPALHSAIERELARAATMSAAAR